ncbi:hypothetical protein FAGKG844_350014 [Frankia sp. AgKG'84/4]
MADRAGPLGDRRIRPHEHYTVYREGSTRDHTIRSQRRTDDASPRRPPQSVCNLRYSTLVTGSKGALAHGKIKGC